MIKIRLKRQGVIKNPYYSIVATEKSLKRGGKSLEVLGSWHPLKNEIKIKNDRLQFWVKNGAVINESVKKLMK